MKSDTFLRKVPFLKPLEATEEEVLFLLMRIGGNLESVQGFKSNPEIAGRINENQTKLLQHVAQILLGLQAKLVDSDAQFLESQIAALRSELSKAHELIAHLTEEKSRLEDLLSI